MARTGGIAVVIATAAITTATAGARAVSAQAVASGPASSPDRTTISTYCVPCHTARRKSGGVSLATFDIDNPGRDADTAEKVIRKLRSGMMPPAGATQPGPGVLPALANRLEHMIDAGAARGTDPGSRAVPTVDTL